MAGTDSSDRGSERDDIGEVVAAVMRERGCPGAVVASSRAGAVRIVAYGSAAADVAQPVDAESWFEIGSITKVLVATLILQHVARGELRIDDPVTAYLPGFRLADTDATNRVTIRHLLTHASGIDRADDFTDTGDGEDCVRRYVDEVVAGSSLVNPVGDRWSYCNAGYVILGRIVEVLDGRPWDVALAERILRPCGMDASSRRLAADRAIAVGHRVDPVTGSVDRVTKWMPTSLGPAGNVVATAESLVRFADVLFGESEALLPSSLVAEMLVPQIAVHETHQALGWMLLPAPVPVATHGGSTIGYTAFLGAIPALKTALAVVANGPGAGAIASAIYAQRSGNRLVPPPVATQPLDLDAARLLTGRYARRHVTQDVDLVDGALIARTTFLGPAAELFAQPPPAALECVGGLQFVSRQRFAPDAARWDFEAPDGAGRPARLFTQRVHVRERT